MAKTQITFHAAFPPIQSAIRLDGQGGARIQLDVPESDIQDFIGAMAWRGSVMVVTLTLEDNDDGRKWAKKPRF